MRKRIFSLVLSILMLLCLFPAVAVAEQDAWGVIGNICGTNWDTDFQMTEIEPNVWQSEELELNEGDTLKVRYGGTWDQNYGIAHDWDGSDPMTLEARLMPARRYTFVELVAMTPYKLPG